MEENTQTFDATGIENISIDFPAGELKVHMADSDSEEVVIRERRSSNAAAQGELECKMSAGTLAIEYKRSAPQWLLFSWFTPKQRELEVIVPRDLGGRLGDFTLHSASGNASVEDIGCESASIDVSSGKMALSGLTAKKQTQIRLSSGLLEAGVSDLGACTLDVASGKIDVAVGMESLDAKVKSGHASIACTSDDVAAMDIDVSSGKVDLALPEGCGFNAAVSKSSGSFNCEFDASVRGEVYTHGDGTVPIDIHISSGVCTLKPL